MESIQYFESNSQNIGIISQASKSDCPSESIIPGELCDACILAQKENKIVLTEDYLYLKWNELETKKNAPEQLSSIVLVKKMYERKLITFEQYLDYFEYLSFHRFKFMAFSHTDIIKAVFGDQIIIAVKPTNIRKLNFPLTLSEEYGVLFRTAFIVVFKFLIYVLTNDSIISDIAEQIFVEIIESFPTQMDKKDLGQLFLDVSKHLIDQNVSNYIITPRSQLTQEKLDKLYKLTKVYDFKIRLWKPKIA